MSWFDTAGLASFAKSALKEAQKTLDKALDIKDEDIPGDDENDQKEKTAAKNNEINAWGSFTGSYFDVKTPKSFTQTPTISPEAPLATPEKELTPIDATTGFPSKYTTVQDLMAQGGGNVEKSLKDDEPSEDKVRVRPKPRRNSLNRNSGLSNRLSAISLVSSESERRSSESVDVLGSRSEATSPDSVQLSCSSSIGLVVSNSCTDSVEVIDSLASPSSIEVIAEMRELVGSPEVQSPGCSTDSVEVLEELEDDMSGADSYTSMSESTGTTMTLMSHLLRSGASTPDVLKLSMPSHGSCDLLCESIQEVDWESPETSQEVIKSLHSSPIRRLLSKSEEKISGKMEIRTEKISRDQDTKTRHRSKLSTNEEATKSALNVLDGPTETKVILSGEMELDMQKEENTRLPCDTPEVFDSTLDNGGEKMACGIDVSLGRVLDESFESTKAVVSEGDGVDEFLSGGDVKSTKVEIIGGNQTVDAFLDVKVCDPTNETNDSFLEENGVGGGTHLDEMVGETLGSALGEVGGRVEDDLEGVSGGMVDSDSQSDCRTTVESSCDGTLMGSSSEDCTVVNGPSESPPCDHKGDSASSASSSVYMKELLAEAIREDPNTRETSPTLSDKSKSDLVKVGSEQTSGHTSGDEIETTTSSDIEIISRYSPNGDSSSTASRHSPAKLSGRQKLSLLNSDVTRASLVRTRPTHQRNLSEASSACSEESFTDAERLSRKIMELTEVLEAREAKLVELSRSNLEMQDKNLLLKKQLETASRPQETGSEKDELIRDLREEGEKLSKMQLKQSNVIKTLRKQEQSQQVVIASYKKQIDALTKELDNLKEKLAGSEELERSRQEQMKLMTGKVVRQDKEIATLMDQLEQAVIKAEQLRINLDVVQDELQKKTSTATSLENELKELSQAADTAKRDRERVRERERERDSLIAQLENLREQTKLGEINYQKKETQLKEEKKSLVRRLEEAEGRNEELAQSMSQSTRPLLKQLEQLQASCNMQREAWEARERQLYLQLEEATAHEASAKDIEKTAKTEVSNLRARVASMEKQLAKANDDIVKSRIAQEDLHGQLNTLEQELIRVTQEKDNELESMRAQLSEAHKQMTSATEAAAAANERAAMAERAGEGERVSSLPPSPTLSFGKLSVSGSEWQMGEDAFDSASVTGRNVYDSMRGGSSTLLEGLQAQLKMRDGEASQLQWELQRRDAERTALTAELTALTASLAARDESLARAKYAHASLAELQRNYDALLQIHGEKVEEVEELRLDLIDVKEMYKAQIDQLLERHNKEKDPT